MRLQERVSNLGVPRGQGDHRLHCIRNCVTAIALTCAAAWQTPACAIEAIPETPGWRGFVIAGVGHIELRSNFVSGNDLGNIGNSRLESLGARPARDEALLPVITGEINYTFGRGWQAFFGTSLEDVVTLDNVMQLGARKDLGATGVIQTGLLFSGTPTKTWEDPYAEGVSRERTDRDSTGFRLQWDRVMDSALELTFSYRDISIDEERSGDGVTSVPCALDCRDLLRRDGDQYSFDASYLFRLGVAGNHLVRPQLRYTNDERDGDALAGNSYRLQLSHIYIAPRYTISSNIAYGETSRDAVNPIVGVKTDEDRFLIGSTLFYRLPALGDGWQAVASLLWGRDDSSSRFHDAEAFMVTAGLMYRFGAP